MNECIVLENVSYSYSSEETKQEYHLLDNINLTINPGELIVIGGPSGEGKSTLFSIISGLLTPVKGHIKWGAYDITKHNKLMERSRNDWLGIVFQNYMLVENLSGIENIYLPGSITGNEKHVDMQLIEDMLIDFFPCMGVSGLNSKGGLWKRLTQFINIFSNKEKLKFEDKLVKHLSGGQRERIAILRAFSHNPRFILADEILKSVEPVLRKSIWGKIKSVCREKNLGLVLISHDEFLLNDQSFNKVYRLEKGSLKLVREKS
jgi:ABC-type lipoprotein export system ATPase subunit